MKRTWMPWALVLFLLSWGVNQGWAQDGLFEGMGMPMMGGKHAKAMGGLQLTDEQKSKMMDLRLELQKEVAPLRARLMTLRTDLKLLMTADRPDMRKIEAKQAEISKVQGQIAMAHIRHQLSVREMLNPEQRKKFDAFLLSGKKGKHGKGKHDGGCDHKPRPRREFRGR